MHFAKSISSRIIGAGLLALFAILPPLFAQQRSESRGAEPQRSVEPQRAAPARAPAVQRSPTVVDRVNHGSLRHVAPPVVVQRPVQVPHNNGNVRDNGDVHGNGNYVRHDIVMHHDVDVDVNHHRFWHDFSYGARIGFLPEGYISLNVNGAPYFYDDGIYYQQTGDSYDEVYPPIGAEVPDPPDGAVAIEAGNQTYYYAGGAFYVQQGDGYVIAPTPIGVTVPELPPGAVQVSVNGTVAYQFNGIYYQPEFIDGVTQYVTFMP